MEPTADPVNAYLPLDEALFIGLRIECRLHCIRALAPVLGRRLDALGEREVDQLLALRAALAVGQQPVAGRADVVDCVAADVEHFALRADPAEADARVDVVLVEAQRIERIEMKEVARHRDDNRQRDVHIFLLVDQPR
jgi:hypothetical protein